jgi:hypothetical protein
MYISEHFTDGPYPAIKYIYVLMNSVFGTCSQKAKVTCLQTVCRSLGVKSKMKEDGSLNHTSYRLYQVINVLLVPQLRLQTDVH